MAQNIATMIQLPHGCKCSPLKVHPQNWNDAGASVKKDWYIYYRFHDPLFRNKYPKGKLVMVKGMNEYKTLAERRAVTKDLIKNELQNLQQFEFNPINGTMKQPEEPDISEYIIDPATPLCEALKAASERLKLARETHKDIRSVLKYFNQAAEQLRLHGKAIRDIKRRHVRMILDQIGKNKTADPKASWTATTFNFYRGYLMIIFKVLVDHDIIETNPVKEIEKQKTVQKLRQTLTDEQREKVDRLLRARNYRLWRFMHIFFHSGSRIIEITRVKGSDVDLDRQEVNYFVKKGKQYRWVVRPIKDIALPLWKQAMVNCGPDDYVFSEGLQPGPKQIRAEQITRRWRLWVKTAKDDNGKPLGIEADFYSLKHLNTTSLVEQVGISLAAKQNQHTPAVLTKYYDVKGKDRELELLKKVSNTFVP